MHLLIDAQCLQTDTMERGIGTYGQQLLRALSDDSAIDRLTVLLNHIADPTRTARALSFITSLQSDRLSVRYFDSPSARLCQFASGRRLAEQLREQAIADIAPDAVLVLSAFQRRRETILAPRRGTPRLPTAVLLYDLIPLQYPQQFLYTPGMRRDYDERLKVLADADLLLSISAASASEWQARCGPRPGVVVIGGGVDGTERLSDPAPLDVRAGSLCLGGEGPHKNLEFLISAYALLPAPLRAQHPLTIAGLRSAGFVRYLRGLAPGSESWLLLPGYVDRAALARLLSSTRLLVAPSRVEGLGLPVLEAAAHGTPAIVARSSALAELIPAPSLQFSTQNPGELTAMMAAALTDDLTWHDMARTVDDCLAGMTWQAVASRARAALVDLAAERA